MKIKKVKTEQISPTDRMIAIVFAEDGTIKIHAKGVTMSDVVLSSEILDRWSKTVTQGIPLPGQTH